MEKDKLVLKLKSLIANGETLEAIQLCIHNFEGEEKYANFVKELYLISNRLHEYKQKERVGTLLLNDNTLAILNSNFLDLVAQLESGVPRIPTINASELDQRESAIKKAEVDTANGLLQSIIKPPLEELGLLVADNIKYWRFKNQVKILLKANKYLQKKRINPKPIPMKILVPLLENASLEEDESLQDKWAAIIVNLISDAKFYESNIYPFLLSQLSPKEVRTLDGLKVGNYMFTEVLLNKHGITDANISNLIRLGLIEKGLPRITENNTRMANDQGAGTRLDTGRSRMNVSKQRLTNSNSIKITDLGIDFVEICTFKAEYAP